MLSNSHGILDLKLSSPPTPIISLWEIAEDQPPAEREFFMKKNHEILIFSNLASFFTYLFYFCKNDSETRRSFNGKIKRKNQKEASLPLTQVWICEKMQRETELKERKMDCDWNIEAF